MYFIIESDLFTFPVVKNKQTNQKKKKRRTEKYNFQRIMISFCCENIDYIQKCIKYKQRLINNEKVKSKNYSYKDNISLQLLFQHFQKCLLSGNGECSSPMCSASSFIWPVFYV